MRVPIELVLEIFDAFAVFDDANPTHSYSVGADALRTCALVCRGWALPAQKRLVRHQETSYIFPFTSNLAGWLPHFRVVPRNRSSFRTSLW